MPEGDLREAGLVRGRHYTEYVEEVKMLRRSDRTEQAERLLFELIDATEAEALAEGEGWGVAPWYYEQLAILYSKRGDWEREIAVLERFAEQPHAPGSATPALLRRLAKKRK
jgi:hypothetical protein